MNAATAELSTRIVELAHERRRFGYRRMHNPLALGGRHVNHKRVWRLYKLANLPVRKIKRPIGGRQHLAASQYVNDTWSMDFVMDALANGQRIKCLTVVNDFSRECVDIVDHGMGGEYVLRLLDQAAQFRGYPRAVRTDQGPEFTSRRSWGLDGRKSVRHLFNDAGCPTQNA